ncbi:hypothetical protein DSCO28_24380 [Desulfosarcina ovata subsp. sediminis]|uniref:Outer membrane protein beta-barrel domain-containing protein n=1 Tax=Desulfosarcina ovata subsp. sediminis TaxID=885957 RepID=A0A5K7ZIC5_9BACT|nr:hypothetical protein [Desulfosarcina ovata]BBO81872.1 hypothetical protein DSCO28_24380 [Desulfosarcina ovata subsp. sediminis]
MKKTCTRLVVCSLLTLLVLPGIGFAGDDFFDVLSWAIEGSGADKTIDAGLYGALATLAWNDENQNGDMDGDETLTDIIRIYDRDGNLVIESNMEFVQNRDDIEEWALENFDLILSAIFPGGLNMSTGDTADSIMLGISFGDKLSKASPARKESAEAASINNEFKGVLEYVSLSVNDEDGDATSILLGYSHEYDGGAELGILLPYRYTTMDDAIDSESHFAGLSISGKYPIKKWDSMVWDAGVEVFGSAYYLTSDAIEHAGNLQYGAGAFSTFTKTFSFATVSVGVDYRISEIEVRESWIDTDNQFVEKFIDYLNDLDSIKTLTYGCNIGVPLFADAAAVNLEIIRSDFSSDDIPDGRDSQTTAGLSFSYYPSDTFELNVGVRETYELEDIDLVSVYIGSVYRF